MKAMILAAGLGTRMQPLTNFTPKPLLKVGDRYLIEFHLEKLSKAGIKDIIVNTHCLAEQIPAALGTGENWGLNIHYSYEPELLETAGGIRQVISRLVDSDSETFLLINGDVFFEWDLTSWLDKAKASITNKKAFLALVPNPLHHLEGDFFIQAESGELKLKKTAGDDAFTYSGIGLYKTSLFSELALGYRPLGPLLKDAVEQQLIVGQVESAYWLDVGTPERLEELKSRQL
ncbi:MAG: MurNAc alpha-1-phosphate uridylyltransferase [Oleiphilaceae bacterium]|jgi:MurNAc alpha-1-phosphate uridylyltransferase